MVAMCAPACHLLLIFWDVKMDAVVRGFVHVCMRGSGREREVPNKLAPVCVNGPSKLQNQIQDAFGSAAAGPRR